MTPQEPALWAIRKVHALCVRSSGNNAFADIPMNISVSSVRVDEQGRDRRGRVATHCVRIRPDAARLLDSECVSDKLYESIRQHEKTVTEGEGATKLFGLLSVLSGDAASDKRKPVRYSLNAGRDRQLIRSYLWREGYDWRQTEGIESPLAIVDVRHALTIIAGISRTMSLQHTLPKELRDYDLDACAVDGVALCRMFGVQAPNQDAESSALFRLLHAARAQQYAAANGNASEQPPDLLRSLKALGGMFDHLEGLAGENAAQDGPGRQAGLRARRLVDPLPRDTALTPAEIGLFCHEGAWFPVAPPPSGSRDTGGREFLHALPDGRPVPIERTISAPLARLDLLSSDGRWDANADERLRRICGWEGEPISLRDLIEAYRQSSGDWPPPENATPPAPAADANPWGRMSNGMCEAGHYALAGKALHAINKSDAQGAHRALEELAAQASTGAAGVNLQTLLANLRLAASRAGLINDGREAWLGQMALLLDPAAWPGSPVVDSERLPVMLFGDGLVARHNRLAVACRSSLGIPASSAVRTALSAPPRSVGPDQAIN